MPWCGQIIAISFFGNDLLSADVVGGDLELQFASGQVGEKRDLSLGVRTKIGPELKMLRQGTLVELRFHAQAGSDYVLEFCDALLIELGNGSSTARNERSEKE